MTAQEAIKTMEYFDRNFGDYEPNHEAIQMAIEALSNNKNQSVSELKTTTGAVSESDVIYRADAITLPIMPKEHREYQTLNLDDAYEQGWLDLQKCIENLPSAHLVNDLVNDCISRQQAIDALDKHIDTFDAIDTNYLCGLRTAMSFLKEMPSARPEIIRCKDCEYWEGEERNGFYYFEQCSRTGFDALCGDYCSYAERRTDETD